MTPRFHLPGEIRFRGAADGIDRAAVEAAIRAGIVRGLAGAAGSAEIRQDSPAPAERLGEPFDPSRHRAERGAYTVPSYDEGGEPVELPLEEPFEEERIPDQLFTSPGPLEGRLLAIFPRWTNVHVRSGRYAVVPNLARALVWGNLAFGGHSFGVLEGPGGFWVVRTDEPLSSADLRLRPAGEIQGQPVVGNTGWVHWEHVVRDGDGNAYRLRTLVTVEGDPLFPPERDIVEEFLSELGGTPGSEAAVSRTVARSFLFGEIDRLLAADQPEAAAPQIAGLDANAFSLLDWETKALYLEALLAVWTGEAEEIAIVEIFKSVRSRSELDAALALLRDAGRFDDLFVDLDEQLWSLLALLGARFGNPEPLTFGRLVALLQEADLLPDSLGEAVARVALGPAGPVLSLDALAEIEEAAYSFVRFLGSTAESLGVLLTHPERVVEGIAQVVRLVVAVHLSLYGHEASRQLIGGLLDQVGRQLLAGVAGAELLGVSERILRRIRWALLWEIASMFVGVGEIRAAMTAAGAGEKALALVRLARLLAAALEAGGDAAVFQTRMARLAAAISRSSPHLGEADRVLTLISYLPASDVGRLGRALRGAELSEAVDLARLAAEQPALAREVEDLIVRCEALSDLARRVGGLGDEAARAFERLAAHGLSAEELRRVAAAVPEDAGGLFAQALERLEPLAVSRGSRSSAGLLELLAPDRGRLQAVVEEGPRAVEALHRRSGSDGRIFDGYLEALHALRDALPAGERAAGYQRLLDQLGSGGSGGSGAWIRLESSRRLRSGEPILTGLDEAIEGHVLAQRGFDRLLRGRSDALLDEIADDILPDDPDLARRTLEHIGSLDETQARGLTVLHEISDELPGAVTWADVFDLPSASRNEILELVARTRPDLEETAGLARLLGRVLTGPGTNVQGTLGHLWAVRTLQRRFPGGTLRLEVRAGGREIDILVRHQGRRIAAEVKTGLTASPPVSPEQIRRDLIRHLDDRFEDLLYLYEPGQQGALDEVREAFRRALAHPQVRAALHQRGIAPAAAESWLDHRLSGDLVGTFNYAE